MKLDPAVGIMPDAIEHVDDRTNLDVEAGFLANFAADRSFERLAHVHGASWKAPLALERLVGALHQHDAVTVEHHRADADNRPLRIFPHITHHLHHDPLLPLPVELGVEHLLPRTEIELAVGDRQHHLWPMIVRFRCASALSSPVW